MLNICNYMANTFVVFVFIIVFDKCVNAGGYVANLYEQSASLWRPKDQIAELMYLTYIIDAALALIFTCLFKPFAKGMAFYRITGEGQPDCYSVKSGLCFGLQIGLLMAALQLCSYISMPITAELARVWFASTVVEGLGIGLLLSLLCNKSSKGGTRSRLVTSPSSASIRTQREEVEPLHDVSFHDDARAWWKG